MLRWLILGLALAALAFWWLTRPLPLSAADLPEHRASLANGERAFHAGGCASCHGTVRDGGKPAAQELGGGLVMATPAGTFHVPNISSHPEDGIGAWTDLEFVNAMRRGLSPDGRHYYPAFPYTSYARADTMDLLDLKAWLDSLPAVEGRAPAHELDFPYGWRRPIGAWKRLFLDDQPVRDVAADEVQIELGRSLVEGLGHCGECHTPRNVAMAMDPARWLQGAPLPAGEGRAPDITGTSDGIGGWSAGDLAYYLETGVDPDYDIVGGDMVAVQENMAKLSEEDRQAIAAYLKSITD
ncbi:c-type cytochrome [Marinihelvus fidelis]|uniref:C-type cytochrome n=1 Tax=Marinihelvus fidelis TaxID=2613842 RepID=A0A5N0TDL7_9GAMM|nr:cytochrome c [Marinihelvus fidelis]KAA9131389.1 c-type cytochrome [Marinihelvus fidelis]